MAERFTSNVAAPTQNESLQAEASAQPTKEHASTADDNQAANETESTRADEAIPTADEISRATTSVAREEQTRPAEASIAAPELTEQARVTALIVTEVNEPISNAPPAPTLSPVLPSASEAKKTKAAERAVVKKRKASTTSESSAPKKVKNLTRFFQNLIHAIRVSSMPSKEIVPFGEDYVIPCGSDEEDPSATSSQQLDEEIEVDYIPSTPLPAAPETVIPEAVKTLTDTPQPNPKNPFSKKHKFKADDFFHEHVFFTDYNP
nr:uncharacterized protein LOC120964860 [Aegilops tauschii subsp. strangulata]